MNRYAAEILFAFINPESKAKKNICERKIAIFEANNPEDAYLKATEKGASEEFSFSDEGVTFQYLFLGVSELISLESEDGDIAWATYEERLTPLERIGKFIPPKSKLKAFNNFNKKGKIKLLK
ncbi:DUF4288 domain-containing protein [Aquipseudomonas alcaligenes]|uniref:DUF4288 domain-containing protein n=2 Tax=Pseudomonadaceae TaxID=135621 RepID=A0AB73HZY4_AQUAC|nr:DUF4288 domain-containing protein [Pseudomonas alcaligenes]MDH0142820.1 DUF4288 domain-containing protein [Pseudomonas alcaligenes]